jgi:type II restriction enzyme
MIGISKTTQMINRDVWRFVPLQDFTSSSDIDWSKSIAEIDEQLFDKYGLYEPERDFIRTKVKEMS